MRRRKSRRWIALAVLGLAGAVIYFYGLALGALLLSTCGSLSPPFSGFRCAQPYVATIVGAVLFALSCLGACWEGLAALYRARKVRAGARRQDGKLTLSRR